jgi:hypothetical protein
MHFRIMFLAASLSALPSIGVAQSLDQKIQSCLSESLSEEEKKSLAIEISGLKNVFSSYVINNVAACFTKITGEPSAFANGVGLTTNQDLINELEKQQQARAALQNEQAERKAQEEAALAERAELATAQRRVARCELLELRSSLLEDIEENENLKLEWQQEALRQTILECTAWAKEDKRSAITNTVCHKVFADWGFPEIQDNESSLQTMLETQLRLARSNIQLNSIDTILEGINYEEKYIKENSEVKLIEFKNALSNRRDNDETKDVCDSLWEEWKIGKN